MPIPKYAETVRRPRVLPTREDNAMPAERNAKDDMGEGSFRASTRGEESASPQGPRKVPVKKGGDAAGAPEPKPKR